MPNIKLITRNLANELIPGIRRASGIYILTSFVMDSGVPIAHPDTNGGGPCLFLPVIPGGTRGWRIERFHVRAKVGAEAGGQCGIHRDDGEPIQFQR